jgi:twitching motility protein PilT
LSSQLEQLLGYLERDGVTEVLFGSGRPIAMRKAGAITNITARPLSADQLANMVRGSEITSLIPELDGEGATKEIVVGKRRAIAQVARRGADIVVSLTRSEGTATAGGTLPRVAEAPRAKSPTRSKSPSIQPRNKPATSAPRTKGSTSAPRSKTPTRAKSASGERSKTGTAVRIKSPTNAPRTKAPTAAPRKKAATAAPKPRTTTSRAVGIVAQRAPSTPPEASLGSIGLAPSDGAINYDGAMDFSLDDGLELGAPVKPISAPPPVLGNDGDISLGPLGGDAFELELGPANEPPTSFDVDFSTSPPQSHQPIASIAPSQNAAIKGNEFARVNKEPFAKARSDEGGFAKPRSDEGGFAKPRANEGFAKIDRGGGFAKPQPVVAPPVVTPQPVVPTTMKTLPIPAPAKAPAGPAPAAYAKTAPGPLAQPDPFGQTGAFSALEDDDPFAPPSPKSSTRRMERANTELHDAAPQEIAHAGTQPIQLFTGGAPIAKVSAPVSSRSHNPAFTALVHSAREAGASDLHIAAARVTSMRINGELVPVESHGNPLSAQGAEELLIPLLETYHGEQLEKIGYVDFALEAPGGGRLRANISRQQQGLKGTFRLAMASPPTLEQLGLPADIAKVISHHQGLVVIAGPSGHGKTTTLAAFVDLLNSTKPYHILTIEDPVEIVHPRKMAVVSQRESGRHTQSFARGLKASLREDPDVIVIGELRDRESVEIALTAAETGHLVIATMSTPSAAKTIDRLIDMFPPEEHSQVRASIAGALRAIVAQRLLPRRGGGIVPAIELVTGVLPLAVLIRDDKLFQLPSLMQRGRAFGMIRFDESLAEHVRAGRIDEETALANADSKKDLAAALKPAAAAPQPAAKTNAIWGFGKKENR